MKANIILALILLMFIFNVSFIFSQVCASDGEVTIFCGLTDTPTQQTQEQSLTDNSSYQTLGIIIFLILISLLSIVGILAYKKVKKWKKEANINKKLFY